MYSLRAFGEMIGDTIRTDAYLNALRKVVTPHSVVVDIGSGPGIFSLFACRLGARKVYAIEPDDSIQVGREIAAAHGYLNHINFIQDLSTRIALPEPADIIVSDIRGILPFFRNHIPSIIDARQRLLMKKGILIPQIDTLWMAVLSSPEVYARATTPWKSNDYDFDLSKMSRYLKNSWIKVRARPEELITDSTLVAKLDYNQIKQPNLNTEVILKPNDCGIGYGLLVWFDSLLLEGISYSNLPGNNELVYGCAFFPWEHPVDLSKDDIIKVNFDARLIGEDYVWSWKTHVLGQGNPKNLKVTFTQSNFYGDVLSLDQLKKMKADFSPKLSENGELDLFILTMIKNNLSLREISKSVGKLFPNQFPSLTDALTYVGELSKKYSIL